jgi:hypothetical protein
MSGIFGGGSRAAAAPVKTVAQTEAERDAASARARSEERASSKERSEMQGIQQRRRLRRSGGLRLLFSPARQEGPDQELITKLGGGN